MFPAVNAVVPERVLLPATDWVVVKSTKFFVVLFVPPLAIGRTVEPTSAAKLIEASEDITDPLPLTYPVRLVVVEVVMLFELGAVGCHLVAVEFQVRTLPLLGDVESTGLPCKPTTFGEAAVLPKSPASCTNPGLLPPAKFVLAELV